MRRRAWVATVTTSVLVALVLGYPYSCGQSECPDPGSCPPTCENALGMSFRGAFPGPLLPILATIGIGVAAGWLIAFAISKLRSRGD